MLYAGTKYLIYCALYVGVMLEGGGDSEVFPIIDLNLHPG